MSSNECACAVSYNLSLFLAEAALDWAKDEVMRKYVPDHLERISEGLGYVEKHCGVELEDAKENLKECMVAAKENDWDKAHRKIDDLYIQVDRKITRSSGYIHTPF
jgi:hypothetical protein